MQYFNPVEDVLDIQLTPYGKQLLSQGKFKPAQYSFSDEGILYNYETTKRSETQNSANERILNETPYTKVQARNDACITSTNIESDPSVSQNNIFDSIKTIANSLGNSELGGQISPKTNIYILDGTLSGSSEFMISPTATLTTLGPTEGHDILKIPQIDIDILYRSTISNGLGEDEQFLEQFLGSPLNTDNLSNFTREGHSNEVSYIDGGIVYVTRQKLFLLIEEENTRNSFENFDIEVFDIQDEIDPVTKTNVLRKLRFPKTEEDIKVRNNIYVDNSETNRIMSIIQENTSFVEDEIIRSPEEQQRTDLVSYYLFIKTDTYEEILEQEICNYVSLIKSRQLGFDIPYECPDRATADQTTYDIYTSDDKQVDNC